MRLDKQTIRVVCGVLAHPQFPDLVLMGLRPPSALRPNLWELPGGKVDPGEGPERALEREFREELDVSVRTGGLLATGIIHADLHVLISAYELSLDLDVSSVIREVDDFACMSPRAHQELRWAGLGEAVRRMPCSPGFYVHHPFLELWMMDRSDRVLRSEDERARVRRGGLE